MFKQLFLSLVCSLFAVIAFADTSVLTLPCRRNVKDNRLLIENQPPVTATTTITLLNFEKFPGPDRNWQSGLCSIKIITLTPEPDPPKVDEQVVEPERKTVPPKRRVIPPKVIKQKDDCEGKWGSSILPDAMANYIKCLDSRK